MICLHVIMELSGAPENPLDSLDTEGENEDEQSYIPLLLPYPDMP